MEPANYKYEEIRSHATQIAAISLTDKEKYKLCSQKLKNLKKTWKLVKKYHIYKHTYEFEIKHTYSLSSIKAIPQLVDALFTGYLSNIERGTINKYTEKTEKDIKSIIELMPESMNCKLASMPDRLEVPPLAVACYNEAIPINIIKYMLKKGANPNITIQLYNPSTDCYAPVKLLVDLKNNLEKERLEKIEGLFKKYGYQD